MASNSVLGNSRSLDELIQLQLLESFCLPILQYATCAVKLSSSQSAELNSCWNNKPVFSVSVNMTLFMHAYVVLAG